MRPLHHFTRWVHEGHGRLSHPGWWLALLLLVANDHILKGADVLPNWLTGKLSDFAGMIVAPVLLVSVLRPKRRAMIAMLFGMVALAFAAINVSEEIARAVVAAGAHVALPLRIWTDPTDLIALLMLPVAWKIANVPRLPRVAPIRSWERAGVALGGLACMATAVGYEETVTAAFVYNATREDVALEVRRYSGTLDCDVTEEEFLSIPSSEFAFDASVVLSPHTKYFLDRDPDAGKVCRDAVTLSGPRLGTYRILWSTANLYTYTENLSDPVEPDTVMIEQFGDELLVTGDRVRVWRVE